MAEAFNALQTLFVCATVFGMGFIILLALPKSKLRSYCLEVMKYLMAMGLAILVVSPVDVMPDFVPILGQADDIGYIVGAIASVASAIKERKERARLM